MTSYGDMGGNPFDGSQDAETNKTNGPVNAEPKSSGFCSALLHYAAGAPSLFRSRIAAAIMALSAVAPAAWIVGCEDHGSGGTASAPLERVALESGRTLIGAGWVNDWCWVPSGLLREQVRAMADAGWDAYLIEMGVAARWNGHTEEEVRKVIAERYPELVDMLADEGMILLNSIQNDNAGEGKFDDRSPPLSEQTEFSDWLVGLVAAVGRPDVVMVQPVAETKTDAGFALEDLCAAVLTNFTLVNNAGSRPDEKPFWAAYNATHPWGIESVYAEDIVVNDTTQAIIELDADGNMEGATSPAAVQRFFDKCRSVGAGLAGLYIFSAGDNPEVDYETINGVRM